MPERFTAHAASCLPFCLTILPTISPTPSLFPQATTNSSAVAADANNYPDIRLFTVGQGTSSKTPLTDLKTIEQLWAVANQTTVSGGGGFGYFSSVCWFFGKQVHDGLGGGVPLGLISKCAPAGRRAAAAG